MNNEKSKPNDDRSDVKNPNNPAYEADQKNREKQGQEPPAQSPQPQAPKK